MEIQTLEEGTVAAVSVTIITGVYVNHVRNLQVITITAADLTGKLPVTWFNMPYLKSVLKKGSTFCAQRKGHTETGQTSDGASGNFTHGAYEETFTVFSPSMPSQPVFPIRPS